MTDQPTSSFAQSSETSVQGTLPENSSNWSDGIDLGSVIDVLSIQSMMEDFYRLTRIPMSIIDNKGKVLVGVGWQKVCLEFHRANPQSCRNCIESDLHLTQGIAFGEFRLYKCRNNMWDVSTPLMIGGQHVGNVFSGQFFFDDEPIDDALFRSQAEFYGFDGERYMAALREVPRLSRAAVSAGMSYLVKSAQFLSLLSFRNSELAQAVAERDALTRDLRHSEERLKRAQGIAHLGCWELDLVANRLSWSDEVYRIFGVQPQGFEATYEAFLAAVHPEDRAAVNAAYSGSVREGGESYEITHRVVKHGTGEVRWVHEKCEHVRDESGNITRSVGMVQDITERLRAEEQLRHKQKLESIGLLAAGVAHDFNNLLVAVLGNASLAQETLGRSHPVNDLLEGIVIASQKAADLTRQMLAYAGKGRFHIEKLDLSAVVQEMSSLVQTSMPKKVALNLQLEEGPPLIEADKGQIQQVVMNLLINAAEAIGSDLGVVTVITRTEEGDRSSAEDDVSTGRYVCLEVCDNGCGMDSATQAQIFDPFFTTKFTGRGLGLAGVAGIVRTHNAAIHVESAPGQGSRFTIRFPALERAEKIASLRGASERLRGAETILVVDDEECVRLFARKGLEKYGYSVLTAGSGAEAIELCKHYPRTMHAVLLDSSMPALSGAETLPALSQLRPGLKVILSSGYDQEEALSRFSGQEIAGFIQKPYALAALTEKLRATLDS